MNKYMIKYLLDDVNSGNIPPENLRELISLIDDEIIYYNNYSREYRIILGKGNMVEVENE